MKGSRTRHAYHPPSTYRPKRAAGAHELTPVTGVDITPSTTTGGNVVCGPITLVLQGESDDIPVRRINVSTQDSSEDGVCQNSISIPTDNLLDGLCVAPRGWHLDVPLRATSEPSSRWASDRAPTFQPGPTSAKSWVEASIFSARISALFPCARGFNIGSSSAARPEVAVSNGSLPSCPSYNEPVKFGCIESRLRDCTVPIADAGLVVHPRVF